MERFSIFYFFISPSVSLNDSFFTMRKYGKRARKGGRGRRGGKLRRSVRRAPSLAKKAFRLARRIAKHSEETKYCRIGLAADIAAPVVPTADNKLALLHSMSNITNGYSWLFKQDPAGSAYSSLVGNKYFHKATSLKWDIHLDNINNEEETCNFTVAVVSFKGQADQTIAMHGEAHAINYHTDVYQGQAFFDPRYLKIHYYKYFTLTMGGVSPGTGSPASRRYGSAKIKINKMCRRINNAENTSIGVEGQPTNYQDRLYFVVATDNNGVDLESPRINYSVVHTIKETDL